MEINEGSSDSDLSESWNFVDQDDVNNHDAISSDGESVEVIDGDEEAQDQVHPEKEQDIAVKDSGLDVAPLAQTRDPLVLSDEGKLTTPFDIDQLPLREEMFDTSFCWFLFFATSAVLVSHLAFMAADNIFDWNVAQTIESPSFLRDLPITQNLGQQSTLPNIKSWEDDSGVVVETVDSSKLEDNLLDMESMHASQKKPSKVNSLNVRKLLKMLRDMSDCIDGENKFAQALLILDAVNIGLNDLEGVITESTKLNLVLEMQKNELSEALREVEFGISRSMERLATYVLNKVQKLERKFEDEWCCMERNDGFKDEFKDMFYDCLDNNDEIEHNVKRMSGNSNKPKGLFENKNKEKESVIINSDQFEVDKDSAGKLYNKPGNNFDGSREHLENDKYIIKKNKKRQVKERHNKNKDDKLINKEKEGGKNNHFKSFSNDKHNTEKNQKNNYFRNEGTESEKKGKFSTNINKNKRGYYKSTDNENLFSGKYTQNSKQIKTSKIVDSKKRLINNRKDRESILHKEDKTQKYKKTNEKSTVDESTLETISKYLQYNCNLDLSSRNTKNYHKLKYDLGSKINLPKKVFDAMFERHCNTIYDNSKWSKESDKKNVKFDYKKESAKVIFEEPPRLIRETNVKNVVQFSVLDSSVDHDNNFKRSDSNEKVIELDNHSRKWIFSYEGHFSDNNTNISGDWYFKAGQSRSEARWTHRRSDWMFDRASNRRTQPHSNPSSWFPNRRTNWFFRRAWARHQCRQNPYDDWCHLPQDEPLQFQPPNSDNSHKY